MKVLIALCIVVAGFLYQQYDYKNDHSRWLRGIKGWLVFVTSIALAVGFLAGASF